MNDSRNRTNGTVTWLWFMSMALVAYLSLSPPPKTAPPFKDVDKIAHCLAYAWLAALPFFGLRRMRAAWVGALLMIPFGVALEVAQLQVPGRDFSIADMVADGAGVMLGMAAARYVKERPWFSKTGCNDREGSP